MICSANILFIWAFQTFVRAAKFWNWCSMVFRKWTQNTIALSRRVVWAILYNFVIICTEYISRDMTKPTKWMCAQRRLRSAWASAQSDQSSLCAQWVAKDPSFLYADSEDSDQTGRMPRLIWVFAGCTVTLLVLSCRGPYIFCKFYVHYFSLRRATICL